MASKQTTPSAPKWVEVRELLAQRIGGAEWPAGFRVPPEPELADSLRVSRATLREALRSLQEDGLITRKSGAGTYVTLRPRLSNNLDVNFGVSDMIRAMGRVPGTRALHLYETAASDDEAESFGVEPGTPLAVVERVRTADDRPVVLSSDYYPVSALQISIDPDERLNGESLYDFFERRLGILVEHGVASIAPHQVDAHIAKLLEVPEGTLLLYLRQTDYAADGRPVLLSKEYHLADAFDFTVMRRGSRPGRSAGSA